MARSWNGPRYPKCQAESPPRTTLPSTMVKGAQPSLTLPPIRCRPPGSNVKTCPWARRRCGERVWERFMFAAVIVLCADRTAVHEDGTNNTGTLPWPGPLLMRYLHRHAASLNCTLATNSNRTPMAELYPHPPAHGANHLSGPHNPQGRLE